MIDTKIIYRDLYSWRQGITYGFRKPIHRRALRVVDRTLYYDPLDRSFTFHEGRFQQQAKYYRRLDFLYRDLGILLQEYQIFGVFIGTPDEDPDYEYLFIALVPDCPTEYEYPEISPPA